MNMSSLGSTAPGASAPLSRRRSYWLIAVAAVVLILAGVWILGSMATKHPSDTTTGTSGGGKPTTAIIEITGSGFVPSTISVHPNTDIVWVNEDVMPHLPAADPYPSHSDMPSLVAPRALGIHETYTFLVTRKETIPYHDDLNPTMTGTIEVR